MHRKGKLGLLVDDDGESDVEINILCAEWALPPAHEDETPPARDIEVQHVEWVREKQVEINDERCTLANQQHAFSRLSILWWMAWEMLQGLRVA